MSQVADAGVSDVTGDSLVRILATLSNPHRLRVIAAVAQRRNYVSRLARELGISRALLQVHLRKLEAVGLISSELELSEDGKALKFYQATSFAFYLTPQSIMTAVETLHMESSTEVSGGSGSAANKENYQETGTS
ncbi:ArsR/SmtB family transcription factor [Kitasatospora sp. NPDC059327]|uniref:ArsR/SmtB family transcription factor n=1 Tax=Kitasatospora sp. NPDC059327 TaxID=3346803 RepID=UPI0036ADC339